VVKTVAVDWLAIRNDYINGGGSYRKLAEKYGVNKDTIAQKAKSEGWKEQRDIQTDKTQTATIQKTQEKISDALSDEAAAKARIRAKLIRMAENWIDGQVDTVGDTADYRRIVQSCVDMGVFNEEVMKAGETREDDPLTKALKEEAERLNDANQQ
jgi:hypothetical protein